MPRPERKMSRRGFLRSLGIGTAALGASLYAGVKVGRHLVRNNVPAKPVSEKPVQVVRAEQKVRSVERLAQPKSHPKPLPGYKIYYEGLRGEELARAYEIPFTKNVFDLKRPPQNLGIFIRDVKKMVLDECSAYNRVCEINPSGIQLVDPYEVLAIIERESHYNPNALGTSQDKGLGQLTPIMIDHLTEMKLPLQITNPYDPKQNVAGIIRTLAWLKNHPPNKEYPTMWRRLAGYNRGKSKANSLNDRKGNVYAGQVVSICTRLKKENALQGY